MVTTKLNLSMTEPSVRQIYAKQGDTGRVLDISLDQTPEDGTLRILRPDGTEVTSEAVTGGEVSESGETVTFESLTEADVTELTVGIEPVQDLNGYDAPWVGGAGTNKYDDSAKTNALINEQGAESANNAWYLSDYCAIPLGTTKVTLSWQSEMTYYQGRVVAYDSSKTFISGSFVSWAGTAQSHTFDVPSTASYVRVNYSRVVNSQESPRNNVRLNVGTSDLGYSPYSNICPIEPSNTVTVYDAGKNFIKPYSQTRSIAGIDFTENLDGSVDISGTASASAWIHTNSSGSTQTFYVPKGSYVVSGDVKNKARVYIIYRPWGSTSSFTSSSFNVDFSPRTMTFSDDMECFLQIKVEPRWQTNVTIYPMLEKGSIATDYVAYNGQTILSTLPQPVYGGTLDMVSGVLTVTHGNIASYNGETLPSTWISDRDVYASGTTPTTGAQVVYELATPLTYTLTAHQIKTLVGTNNVWASSGQIVNIKFTYGGLLSELPSEATEIVGKCYCDVEQNGVSSMPFTLNVKKNERES